jgi:hypothetical protein
MVLYSHFVPGVVISIMYAIVMSRLYLTEYFFASSSEVTGKELYQTRKYDVCNRQSGY